MVNRLKWVLAGFGLLVSATVGTTVFGTAVFAQEPLPQLEAQTLQDLNISDITSAQPLAEQVEGRTVNSDYESLFLPSNNAGENESASWKSSSNNLELVASDINQTYSRQTTAPAYITQVEPIEPGNKKLAVILEQQSSSSGEALAE